jgi:hypothetical protein
MSKFLSGIYLLKYNNLTTSTEKKSNEKEKKSFCSLENQAGHGILLVINKFYIESLTRSVYYFFFFWLVGWFQ